jgi:hypothetical protein
MSDNVGADELRIRGSLHRLLNGPDATPPPMPSGPPPDGYRPAPRPAADWWDRLYANDEPTPTRKRPTRGPEPLPGPVTKEPETGPRKKPRRQRPTYRTTRAEAPRLSLLDAWDRIPPRVRWLTYHATAAGAGWRIGWVDWSTDTAAWYAADHWTSPSAIALYALGALVIAVYRRSRHWAWPVAWTAAIPVSSVVAGLLLYGTGYQP